MREFVSEVGFRLLVLLGATLYLVVSMGPSEIYSLSFQQTILWIAVGGATARVSIYLMPYRTHVGKTLRVDFSGFGFRMTVLACVLVILSLVLDTFSPWYALVGFLLFSPRDS